MLLPYAVTEIYLSKAKDSSQKKHSSGETMRLPTSFFLLWCLSPCHSSVVTSLVASIEEYFNVGSCTTVIYGLSPHADDGQAVSLTEGSHLDDFSDFLWTHVRCVVLVAEASQAMMTGQNISRLLKKTRRKTVVILANDEMDSVQTKQALANYDDVAVVVEQEKVRVHSDTAMHGVSRIFVWGLEMWKHLKGLGYVEKVSVFTNFLHLPTKLVLGRLLLVEEKWLKLKQKIQN